MSAFDIGRLQAHRDLLAQLVPAAEAFLAGLDPTEDTQSARRVVYRFVEQLERVVPGLRVAHQSFIDGEGI